MYLGKTSFFAYLKQIIKYLKKGYDFDLSLEAEVGIEPAYTDLQSAA